MQAADVMTTNVITVTPDSDVGEIASLLLEHGISAVPVVDADDRVLGIVSEGDLMARIEPEEDQRRSWWLKLFSAGGDAADYVKTHGRKAGQIMTANPLTVGENEPLHHIASLLEKRRIKRVPVVRDGKLVGIVSRSNLLRGFSLDRQSAGGDDGRAIRDAILKEVDENTGVMVDRINVIVADGKVQLWGLVESKEQRWAVQVAAENIDGVKEVENNLGFVPRGVGAV
ncbi:CBS domain-containing protein [Halomonas saccharevitans]|uniref:CBS domain-containing protein n=1 Tax=Halomonas saccharevitans TaxID=416872 RepID=A0A1I7CHZ6_9GAMM|nr:CBS domain-containing protein [Halomonas saccharevitans]SFT99053.1 CBS domain-containing protein [Halomonas saccharevitans]